MPDSEYVNRMTYHAFASDVEAIVPEWTFKVRPIKFLSQLMHEQDHGYMRHPPRLHP